MYLFIFFFFPLLHFFLSFPRITTRITHNAIAHNRRTLILLVFHDENRARFERFWCLWSRRSICIYIQKNLRNIPLRILDPRARKCKRFPLWGIILYYWIRTIESPFQIYTFATTILPISLDNGNHFTLYIFNSFAAPSSRGRQRIIPSKR